MFDWTILLHVRARAGVRKAVKLHPLQFCLEKKVLLFSTSGMMVSLPGFQPAGHTRGGKRKSSPHG